MTRSDADPGLYARSFGDVYDEWYANLHDLDQIVTACTSHIGPESTILELGSGTGRIAGPLAGAGHRVIALEASTSMLLLDGSPSLRVAGDMARLPLVDDCADGALIAYNTLFNLPTVDAQRRCLDEVARALRPDGCLGVEAFIAPADPDAAFGMSIVGHHTHADGRMAIVTWHDPEDPHLITGAHVELRPDGARSRPWLLTYQSPVELDSLAAEAGLVLDARHAGWAGEQFDPSGVRHVSWYRHAPGTPVP